MPIMRMTDAKTGKHLSSREGLSLEQLSKEFGFELPTEPSFEVTDAVEKKSKKKEDITEEAPKKKRKMKQ